MSVRSRSRIDKLLALVALVMLSLALILCILTRPATGYELSIYDSVPFPVWILIIGSASCGVVILVRQAFSEDESSWWLAGFLIILFSNLVFLLLPLFRGYYTYGRGDTLSHLGFVRDILVSGRVGTDNFYPMEHLLATGLFVVADLHLEHIPMVLFPAFSGVYLINSHILARGLQTHRGVAILTTAFAAPLIYSFLHVNLHASIFSIFMVPMLIFLYHRRQRAQKGRTAYTMLLIVMALFITLFHPVTALFVILVFLVFGFSRFIYLRISRAQTSEPSGIGRNFVGVCLIMSVVFLFWYLSYSYIQGSFKKVVEWLVYQTGKPLVVTILEPLGEAGLTPLQTMELFTTKYGAIVLMLLTSLALCVRAVIRISRRDRRTTLGEFAYTSLFLTALLLGIVMLFGNFPEYELNPVRLTRFALIVAPVLLGIGLFNFPSNPIGSQIKEQSSRSRLPLQKAVVVGLIVAMIALSFGSVYGSPRVLEANAQVTNMEIEGTRWFGIVKNPTFLVMTNLPDQMWRFDDYNFGIQSSTHVRSSVERLPSHFGYGDSSNVAETFSFRDGYIVIFELDKLAPSLYPENVRTKVHQYTETDFERLRADPTSSSIYCNGEFEIWIVLGT